MKIVTYSLSSGGITQQTQYNRELLISVKSLRRFNTNVAVHVFLYDDHSPNFKLELEEHGVYVHQMGPYVDAISRLRPRGFRSLAYYPVLHKWLNYSELEPLAPTQILQIDCDTFFSNDVDLLFDRYTELQFYAREEPYSRASHYGFDPTYLDEDALFELMRSENASKVGPYNIGVSVLNHGLWTEITTRLDMFLTYIFRFIAGMLDEGEMREKMGPDVLWLFTQDVAEVQEVEALPFPSSNPWIVEQAALWLTLGHIPGLTHGSFCREHVRQGGENAGHNNNEVVYHYFGTDKEAFIVEMTNSLGR